MKMNLVNEKQLKVLVVDDNPANIQVIGNILRNQGYTVGYAIDGQQAINLLKKTFDYDLILLDVDMPLMDGFETCKAIKKDFKLKDIPVIFLTAFTETEKIVTGFDVGGNDYITKPFNSKELLARVNTHLQLKNRNDQIKQMNHQLEINNRNITESITYASRIQKALLPPVKLLSDRIPNFFIMNKPKNIVSGDFYWFNETKTSIYIAAGDGTGHGVPGAFMSILGISKLNEIVKEQSILTPSNILAELRQKIISSFWQKEHEHETNDGMDIALCQINFDTRTLQYAGAFQSIYIVRKDLSANDYFLSELKADHMPIGLHKIEIKEFFNNTLSLIPGDAIYLFTDGFVSQFGGPNDRTFGSKRLKELLLKIQDESMETQCASLEYSLNEWAGDSMQTDDILFIGIKLN